MDRPRRQIPRRLSVDLVVVIDFANYADGSHTDLPNRIMHGVLCLADFQCVSEARGSINRISSGRSADTIFQTSSRSTPS